MPKRLFVLLLFIAMGFAQNVGLGAVNLGNCTFGIAGEAPPPPPSDSIGAEWWYGEPISGGYGYSDTIPQPSNNHTSSWIVGTGGTPEDSLVAFLAAAGAGDTILLNGNVAIDRTGNSQLEVPAGCILAGDRGTLKGDTVSWGALLYQQNFVSDEWSMVHLDGDKARITGLRLRGSYSELEGLMVKTDSFVNNVKVEYGIQINGPDSCIIDNCELWGWGSSPIAIYNTTGTRIDNNHFHHGRHIYKGYGPNWINANGDITTVRVRYNWFDHFTESQIMHGGYDYCYGTYALTNYNIFGCHEGGVSIRMHGDSDDKAASGLFTNNTFRKTAHGYFGNSYAVASISPSRPTSDSIIFTNNWIWEEDSAHSFDVQDNTDWRIENNSYSPTLPDGVSELVPTAVIVADADSGEVPLTVKFKATGSSDPDGTLKQFYWWFGDSCKTDNWDRYYNIEDSTSHTFSEVGTYTVELIVMDNFGVQGIAHKTIKAKPASGSYLTAWVKSWYHGSSDGYYMMQALLDDWVCWEVDVAGNGSWEKIVVDVTDTLALKDSVTVTFRLYGEQDIGSFAGTKMYIDNVHIFGADVVNGDFESGTWSGNEYGRTDGTWLVSENTPSTGGFYKVESGNDVLGGNNAYYIMRSGEIDAGDWGAIYQEVDNPNVP